MKFTRGDFEITKSYNKTLLERMGRVQEIVGDKKTVMSVLVTTYGLKRNEYASRFDKTITMEDLFQKQHHGLIVELPAEKKPKKK